MDVCQVFVLSRKDPTYVNVTICENLKRLLALTHDIFQAHFFLYEISTSKMHL